MFTYKISIERTKRKASMQPLHLKLPSKVANIPPKSNQKDSDDADPMRDKQTIKT